MTAPAANPPMTSSSTAEDRPVGIRNWEASSPRRTNRARAARTSARVRKLKVAFPLMAAVMVVAFFVVATWKNVDEAFLLRFAGINRSIAEPQIVNPEFSYVDERGREYQFAADSAVQDDSRPSIYNLVNPRGVLSPDSVSSTDVESRAGAFDQSDSVLNLTDGVVLRKESYEFRTEAAAVMLDEERVIGRSPVAGRGPAGEIEARSFEILEGGERIIFTGDVRMRLQSKPAAEASDVDDNGATSSGGGER